MLSSGGIVSMAGAVFPPGKAIANPRRYHAGPGGIRSSSHCPAVIGGRMAPNHEGAVPNAAAFIVLPVLSRGRSVHFRCRCVGNVALLSPKPAICIIADEEFET